MRDRRDRKGRRDEKDRRNKNGKNDECRNSRNSGMGGVTLVEVITVMTILAVLAAVIMPSLLGFIEKAKVQQYIAEAYSVRGSAQMLVTEKYAIGTLDDMKIMLELIDGDLTSEESALYPYLKTTCSPGARLTGVTVETATGQVLEIVYEVAGYKITLNENGSKVEETSVSNPAGR